MKKRLSRILNFFAFNLLFFALYLNFIYKDSNTAPPPVKAATLSVQGSATLVKNPEQYINKENQTATANQKSAYN